MSIPQLKSILYVEDDPHVRRVAKLGMELIGQFTVWDCHSGGAALRQGGDCMPDLILLDIMLPDLDGMATLGLLRRMKHLASTPVMFATGLTQTDDIVRYMAAGAIGILAKPLDPARLSTQLKVLWQERPLAAYARGKLPLH